MSKFSIYLGQIIAGLKGSAIPFFFSKEASDDIINCYLLQLAQALKHESYFQCDLVEFLMERALKNQHIGHHLFWELKAEMSSPTHSKQYFDFYDFANLIQGVPG